MLIVDPNIPPEPPWHLYQNEKPERSLTCLYVHRYDRYPRLAHYSHERDTWLTTHPVHEPNYATGGVDPIGYPMPLEKPVLWAPLPALPSCVKNVDGRCMTCLHWKDERCTAADKIYTTPFNWHYPKTDKFLCCNINKWTAKGE